MRRKRKNDQNRKLNTYNAKHIYIFILLALFGCNTSDQLKNEIVNISRKKNIDKYVGKRVMVTGVPDGSSIYNRKGVPFIVAKKTYEIADENLRFWPKQAWRKIVKIEGELQLEIDERNGLPVQYFGEKRYYLVNVKWSLCPNLPRNVKKIKRGDSEASK